ncbi:MAG: IscS subfamily cysteine desulfurase [Deltaproteobacteria bacterium]|nr:IscS subfamily cysteine desulfurase [Deltaproteobacteria bacterium]
MNRPIYLDYNATTPHDSEVIKAMTPFLTNHFGNPSSSHWYGMQTKRAVEKAREQVTSLLKCHTDEIVFTSGGTESNNYAIKGVAFSHRDKGNHIITCQIEHPAVIEVCKFLEERDFDVTYLPVDLLGMVNISDVEKAITPQTVLITIMHANNEVGTIQPIEQISKLARRHGIIMHTDAAQSVGKIPIDVNKLGVDLLSVAGHKLYAPKGVGALYIRKGTDLQKFMHGAGHEGGMRAGTENVLEIAGLGKACEIAGRDIEYNVKHMKEMRDKLYLGLKETIKDVQLNGHPSERLPNTVNVSFKGVNASELLAEITEKVAVSAGSACHSCDQITISPVLKAMKVAPEWAIGTIRFSVGKFTSAAEINEATQIVSAALLKMRNDSKGNKPQA